MLDNLPGGPWLWGIAIVALLAVVIVMQARRAKSVVGRPYDRFDTTEIPPDTLGTREFIVRDDATGARLQFTTMGSTGHIVEVVVPHKHLGTGVEAALFEAALPSAEQVTSWTWPALNADGYAMVQNLARTMPHLALFDANGMQIR
ncbi:hypothetical protein ACL9RL_05145 [Plantibacter sp. Mn2098]|uniref:hypothetical protein n=1 Tax=Plantibacter sp. Mn2098 TaxID=3395266 RepID=UPI003BC0C3A7